MTTGSSPAFLRTRAPRGACARSVFVTVLCAQVCSEAFNALVPGIVAQHKAGGMDIHFTPVCAAARIPVTAHVGAPSPGTAACLLCSFACLLLCSGTPRCYC